MWRVSAECEWPIAENKRFGLAIALKPSLFRVVMGSKASAWHLHPALSQSGHICVLQIQLPQKRACVKASDGLKFMPVRVGLSTTSSVRTGSSGWAPLVVQSCQAMEREIACK